MGTSKHVPYRNKLHGGKQLFLQCQTFKNFEIAKIDNFLSNKCFYKATKKLCCYSVMLFYHYVYKFSQFDSYSPHVIVRYYSNILALILYILKVFKHVLYSP